MSKMTHCDNCKRLIEPGEPMLTMNISEAFAAKPGRPRMQYVPGTASDRPHGLFEVSAELCGSCIDQPLSLKELLITLVGDTPREEFGP